MFSVDPSLFCVCFDDLRLGEFVSLKQYNGSHTPQITEKDQQHDGNKV